MALDIIIDDEKEWPLLLSGSGGTYPTHRSNSMQQTEPKNNEEDAVDTNTCSTSGGTKWEIIIDKTIDLPKPTTGNQFENHNNTLNDDDEWNDVSIVASERLDCVVTTDDSYDKVDTNTIDTFGLEIVDSEIVNEINNKEEPQNETRTLRRSRGNSISSPDLRNIQQQQQQHDPIVIAEDTFGDDDEDYYYDDDEYYDEYDDCGNYSTTAKDWDDTGSFSVLSAVHPESVVSCWSMNNNNSGSNTNNVRSFRDILLMNNNGSENLQQQQPTQQTKSHHSPHKNRRMMSKTRFVVVPTTTTSPAMKRCAKSTNDIPSLVSKNDDHHVYDDDNDHDNHGVEFYYSNKAMGARGRCNGLKLRPDESKRRDMIIHKKNLQRQASGVSSKKR